MEFHSINDAIDGIESVVQELQRGIAPPRFVVLAGDNPAFRHEQYDDVLMSFLKCVRSVSLLRAGQVLAAHGFYQELGILSRCLSESGEDVLFLASPLGEGATCSENQRRLVNEFFQEEFEDPSRTLDTQKKRDRVRREQVLAGISQMRGNGLNPSDAKAVYRVPHFGFSGSVHGAYPHIMELFGCPTNDGAPDTANGHYYMSGRLPAQRMEAMIWQLVSDAERVAITTAIVTKRMGQKHLTERLEAIIDWLANKTGSILPADVGKAMKALKAKQASRPSSSPPNDPA